MQNLNISPVTKNEISQLNEQLDKIANQITQGKQVLHEVVEKIQSCRFSLQELTEFNQTNLDITESIDMEKE